MDLLVIGGAGVDINVSLHNGQWPLPTDADSIFVEVGDLSLGHAGSGVALQAVALGLTATLTDVVGADPYGKFLAAQFPARGVTLVTTTHPAGTRRSVNLVRPDGRRLSLHDPRHPYEWVPDAELWAPLIPRARWVHAVVVNWARYALRQAVEAGVMTSTDLHDWDGDNEHHREFALLADVVFCSAVGLGTRVDTMVEDIFLHGRAQTVAVTAGGDGATIYQKAGDRLHIPAVQPPAGLSIVDTNGAGDAFCATFMAATLHGFSVADAGRRAAYAGMVACTAPGTNARLVTGAELDAACARPSGL